MVEITLAVLAINLRYALIGASLQPIFQGKSLLHKLLMMHLVADENWAVTMAAYRKERLEPTSCSAVASAFCWRGAWER